MTQITLLTYPRSGSNFLIQNLKNSINEDVVIFRTHSPTLNLVDQKILSIARNPIDSITSDYATKIGFFKENKPSKQQSEGEIQSGINEHILQYIQLYSFVLSHPDSHILLFSELISNTSKALSKIAAVYNLPYTEQTIVNPESRYIPHKKFLNSSKDLPEYDLFYNVISKLDLSECLDLFKKAVLKSL